MATRYPLVLVGTQIRELPTEDSLASLTYTAPQRGAITANNSLTFDLESTNNFKATPTTSATLTFTNISAGTGQSGFILLDNSGAHTISAHANTKVSVTALSTISAAGVYVLSYFGDGTNVYVVNSGALS